MTRRLVAICALLLTFMLGTAEQCNGGLPTHGIGARLASSK